MSKKEDLKEIRFVVPPGIHRELKNLAAHSGVTIAQLLRPKVREILNQYPERMRMEPPKDY